MWEGSVKQCVYSTVKSTLQKLIAIATALIVVCISKYILVDIYYVR